MSIKKLSLLILCALQLTALNAQEDLAASQKQKCSDGTQLDMNLCLGKEASILNSELNRKVQKLRNSLRDSQGFDRAQRSWLSFMKTECAFSSSGLSHGNSLYQFSMHACTIRMVQKRMLEVNEHLENSCNGCPPKKEQ